MLLDPVARPYSEALFGLARDRGVVDEVGTQLAEFRDAVRQDELVEAFFSSPVIEPEEKIERLREALGGRAQDMVVDFLCLVTEKGRFGALEDIVDGYLALADEHAGRVRVSLRTAVAIQEGLRREMAEALRAGLQRTVELEAEIDPAMLGGAVVTIGDKVYDGSLRSRLSRFRQQIARRAGNEDQG
jgi:F-type H+-transporting ATPase subunit delta